MTSRGQVCDKWHRYCVECVRKTHLNAAKLGPCDKCGSDLWTRDKTDVKA